MTNSPQCLYHCRLLPHGPDLREKRNSVLWLHAQGGSVPGEAVWETCAESLGAGHGRVLVQLPADAVLGTQKILQQQWGSKMFPDATFYLPFSGLLILRTYLNLRSVFQKNVLARSLSLPWVYWKPALKTSINSNIFMMPFYLLFFSTVPNSYFCHLFKPFSAFIKPYSFS